jgi:hypothetical protein
MKMTEKMREAAGMAAYGVYAAIHGLETPWERIDEEEKERFRCIGATAYWAASAVK